MCYQLRVTALPAVQGWGSESLWVSQ